MYVRNGIKHGLNIYSNTTQSWFYIYFSKNTSDVKELAWIYDSN